MTRKQVQEYFNWDCVSDVNRRLRKLYDVGYIYRRVLPRKCGPTPAVYMIGNEGVKTLASEKRFKVATRNRRRYRFKNLSDNLLPHELLITDYACLLKSTLRRYPDCGIHKWESDEEIVERCNVIDGGADVELKPDAYGSYHLHKTLFNFFLAGCLILIDTARMRRKPYYRFKLTQDN